MCDAGLRNACPNIANYIDSKLCLKSAHCSSDFFGAFGGSVCSSA